jgi:hypothetical protein
VAALEPHKVINIRRKERKIETKRWRAKGK